MPKKKTVNVTKTSMVFAAGIIIGIVLAVLFLCPMMCADVCPLDDECESTCLLIHLRDTEGNPLANTYIAVLDGDANLIQDGYTDAQGDFLCNATIFGCGTGSIKLYAEGSGVQGPWESHIWLSNSSGDCIRDSTTGCCETTWVVEF